MLKINKLSSGIVLKLRELSSYEVVNLTNDTVNDLTGRRDIGISCVLNYRKLSFDTTLPISRVELSIINGRTVEGTAIVGLPTILRFLKKSKVSSCQLVLMVIKDRRYKKAYLQNVQILNIR